MKKSSKAILISGLLSTTVLATPPVTPIAGVEVSQTNSKYLAIQNISNETVKIDIYGEKLTLEPVTGARFECSGYDFLELQFSNLSHDYFEVPCASLVKINESFTLDINQGE